MSTTGKVVRFDDFRGYGFVAPDSGGEDIFVHVNDLHFDKAQLAPGARIEFTVEEGDRGLKASQVELLEQAPRAALSEQTAPSARQTEDGLCDLLSEANYREEVTEILLRAAPGITAEQILNIRQHLVRTAKQHGWITG